MRNDDIVLCLFVSLCYQSFAQRRLLGECFVFEKERLQQSDKESGIRKNEVDDEVDR